MALVLILTGAALILIAPLLFRPEVPAVPSYEPARTEPPRALPPARPPTAPRIAPTPAYDRVMSDPQGRRELEALQAAGGPEPGDVINLSNGRRLLVI